MEGKGLKTIDRQGKKRKEIYIGLIGGGWGYGF